MVLTSKQKDDLNRAIAEYLSKHGFHNSLRQFSEEANITVSEKSESSSQASSSKSNGNSAISDILEKKWVSITRLQKKVMELESENQRLLEENTLLKRKRPGAINSNGSDTTGKQTTTNGIESHDQDESYIPKEPAKFTLQGHRSSVTQVSFHPSYSILATSSEDGSIRLWDFESGQLERALKGHTGTVNSISFDAHGKYLASSSSDLTIRIWDLAQYACIRTLHGHEHNVSDVAFLPSGDFLVSASRDKTLKLWEISSGYCKRTYEAHTDWVKCLQINEAGTQFVSGSSDQTVMLWNIDNDQPKEVFRGHDHVVECVTWASVPAGVLKDKVSNNNNSNNQENGKKEGDEEEEQKSSASQDAKTVVKTTIKKVALVISGSRDKSIKVWNALNGQLLTTLTGHDNWVRSLAVHNNNKYLYSASDDKSLRVWDLEKMRPLRKLHEAHTHFISSVAFNPSYLVLATGSVDTFIRIWDLKDY